MGSPDRPAKFLIFGEQHHAIHSIDDSNDDSGERVSSFAKSGDSGSWLVDLMGRLVAMLHTGLHDGPDSLSFGTPINDTFKQIE